MNGLPTKFCGFPIYLQMNGDLSFSCFCPSEHGSEACNLHPKEDFHTQDIRSIISHVVDHLLVEVVHTDILKSLVQELTGYIPEWKKQVKQRGGVG